MVGTNIRNHACNYILITFLSLHFQQWLDIYVVTTNEYKKIGNWEMKKQFYTFVNHQQNDRSDKLVMTECKANNNKSTSTKLSLLFVIKGLNLCINFDMI